MFDEDMDFGEFRPPTKLSAEIFGLYHPKFKQSIHSLDNEFKNQDDLIKAYAYNTSEGNIREYNEDTIIVLIKKIKMIIVIFFQCMMVMEEMVVLYI